MFANRVHEHKRTSIAVSGRPHPSSNPAPRTNSMRGAGLGRVLRLGSTGLFASQLAVHAMPAEARWWSWSSAPEKKRPVCRGVGKGTSSRLVQPDINHTHQSPGMIHGATHINCTSPLPLQAPNDQAETILRTVPGMSTGHLFTPVASAAPLPASARLRPTVQVRISNTTVVRT